MGKDNGLRKLLIENPDGELKIFAYETDFDFGCQEMNISSISIRHLALFDNEQWMDKEEYGDALFESDKYAKYPKTEEGDKLVRELVNKELEKVEFKNMFAYIWVKRSEE